MIAQLWYPDDPIAFREMFVLRRDDYAIQQADGSYIRVGRELDLDTIEGHLLGEVTLSLYALDKTQCVWGCLDGDYAGSLNDLQRVAFRLIGFGFSPRLEASRRGAHVWLMVNAPVEAVLVRRFLIGLLKNMDIPIKQSGTEEGIEIFPRQDSTERYGNPMRAPLGVHRKSGERYPLLDVVTLEPMRPLTVSDQLQIWGSRPFATPLEVEAAAAMFSDHNRTNKRPVGRISAPIDVRGLDILEWAQRLTQLERRGNVYVGPCPFHSETQGSFTIYANDQNKPHAHCFGCDWHGDAADLKAAATGKPLAEVLREVRASA